MAQGDQTLGSESPGGSASNWIGHLTKVSPGGIEQGKFRETFHYKRW